MLLKAMMGPKRAQFASETSVLYLRLFVLLCSCPSQAVSVGVEGKNYQYLKLIAIVDSTVR